MTGLPTVPPADNHVHSQWSYDTGAAASMVASCERAVALGIPAVAFTEHLDFTVWQDGDAAVGMTSLRPGVAPLDVAGYASSIAECRERFPTLRVLSGVEAGEPHLAGASLGGVLRSGVFDRVLGSLHSLVRGDRLVPLEWTYPELGVEKAVTRYFTELLELVRRCDAFEVLAHVDYPRRQAADWQESAWEEHYRAVFGELASSGRVLEVNTSSPLASSTLVRWWREEGGRAVSFGSDAHTPVRVGDKFDLAVDVVEAAGFRPGRDRFDFWRC
jgi:histidinol-phosphatase (PHP family)